MRKKHGRQAGKSKKALGLVDFDSARPKIIKALNNGQFVARTVSGIAKETSIARPLVVKVLKGDKVLRAQMKVLPRKTSDGRVLLTTKQHFSEKAGFKDRFIDVFATKRTSVDDID